MYLGRFYLKSPVDDRSECSRWGYPIVKFNAGVRLPVGLVTLIWFCIFYGCTCETNHTVNSSENMLDAINLSEESQKTELPFRADREAYKKKKPSYCVKLETTKGDIIIDVYSELAPKGAERFYALVSEGFYNGSAFYRVSEGYIAQAGLSPKPDETAKWINKLLEDDPVKQSNWVGTVALSAKGKNTRCTEFFISLKDNGNMDVEGIAPFGIVRDLQIVDQLYREYNDGIWPKRERIIKEGASYLEKNYPKLDIIKRASICKEDL